jgi:hypothetical protein
MGLHKMWEISWLVELLASQKRSVSWSDLVGWIVWETQSAYKLSSQLYSRLKSLWEDMYCFCIICERNSRSSTDYMVNGNISCLSVQWISVCECMNHGCLHDVTWSTLSTQAEVHKLNEVSGQYVARCWHWNYQHLLSTSSLYRLEMFFKRKVQGLHMSGEDVKCICDVVWNPHVLLLLWSRTRCTCWAQF